MTDQPKDGGPAFPIPPLVIGEKLWTDREADGMSLRDWFAGQALAGLMPSHPFMHADNTFRAERCQTLVQHAFQLADAMLAERVKHADATP